MHFSAMYRLRWYRRAFTRYWASNKCGVGKTNYIPAKCVNITRQMALTAAAFYDSLISRNFSCFNNKKTTKTIVINVILFNMKLTK